MFTNKCFFTNLFQREEISDRVKLYTNLSLELPHVLSTFIQIHGFPELISVNDGPLNVLRKEVRRFGKHIPKQMAEFKNKKIYPNRWHETGKFQWNNPIRHWQVNFNRGSAGGYCRGWTGVNAFSKLDRQCSTYSQSLRWNDWTGICSIGHYQLYIRLAEQQQNQVVRMEVLNERPYTSP